jgi:asparagine synthase (glutamine-hydrolysing)
MCGIFALFGNAEYELVKPYFMKGSKRGPEFSILKKIDVNALFGFHRLAINGLNNESNQPIYHNEYVLICNGEIFNYKELIQRYKLVVKTDSDCEVILHLYERYGATCLNMLEGEFSFIIYNKVNHEVFVARDPFGVRPLYYINNGINICFSSDIAPMGFLYLNECKHFPPGHYCYFNHTPHKNTFPSSIIFPKKYFYIKHEETNFTLIYQSLCDAVKKRVITTERPVACLLSGGLDSSLIAALANRYSLEYKGFPVETYSIGLEDSEDLKYSSKVAEHIKSKHTQIICTNDDFLKSIPKVIEDIESYDTTTVRASVGNWSIGKYIKENSEAKVILNGDGADEVMGGYLYFHACPNELEFDGECRRLLREIHCYDVLRSDKSISSHGLEPRTPYLDPKFVSAYLSLPSIQRFHPGNEKQEKYIIRDIFNMFDPDLLPKEVLYRKKEAFSDGVSGLKKSWYEIIQESLNDKNISQQLYIYNNPETKEQQYYRDIFEKIYPNCGTIIPHFWMPKYVKANDASARTLTIYNEL